MKHIFILSLLFLLIISSSTNCKKNNPESGLPQATAEGKNTCGFLVNAAEYVRHHYPKSFYNNRTTGDIMAHATNDIGNIRNFIGPGIMYSVQTITRIVFSLIILFNIRKARTRFGEYCNGVTLCCYQWTDTIPNHNAYLNITKLDKQKRIVSGTFEFALTMPSCDTVKITRGRFDMKY